MSATARYFRCDDNASRRDMAAYQKRVFRYTWFARCVERGDKFAVIQDTPFREYGAGETPLIAWQRAAVNVEQLT